MLSLFYALFPLNFLFSCTCTVFPRHIFCLKYSSIALRIQGLKKKFLSHVEEEEEIISYFLTVNINYSSTVL